MTELVLRAATATDAEVLSAFDVETWRACYADILGPTTLAKLHLNPFHDPHYFAALIDRCGVDEWLWVIDAGGVIGGYCHFGACDNPASGYRGDIRRIYIAPTFRRRGLGTRILAAAGRRLVEQGLTPIRTTVFVANHDAQRLYERLGAKQLGRHLAFTDRDGRDLWEYAYGWPDPAPLLSAADVGVGKGRDRD